MKRLLSILIILVFTNVSVKSQETDSISDNYGSIIGNYPILNLLSIDYDQLQKSRIAKFHPDRDFGNYYFELKEFSEKEKSVINYDKKEFCRLFYYGLIKLVNFDIVVTLINDTTSLDINDIYLAQILTKDGTLINSLIIGKLVSTVPEKNLEITSKLINHKFEINELYEEYDSPIDEEPKVHKEKRYSFDIEKLINNYSG